MKTVRVPLPDLVGASDPLYTVERFNLMQAATYLNASADYVRNLALAKRIGHGRESRKYVFSQADLDRYRDARRCEVSESTAALPRRSKSAPVPAAPTSILPAGFEKRFS